MRIIHIHIIHPKLDYINKIFTKNLRAFIEFHINAQISITYKLVKILKLVLQ